MAQESGDSMTESKLIVKIEGDNMLIGYKIANVPLLPNQGIPDSITDKKTTDHNEYEMLFSVSKKIRGALKEILQKRRPNRILTFGNFTIGLVDQAITLVVHTHIPLKKIQSIGDRYSITINDSLFHLRVQLTEAFYTTLKKASNSLTPSNIDRPKPTHNQEASPPRTEKSKVVGKKTKDNKVRKTKKRTSNGSLMWAADGSLVKTVEQSTKQKLPQIYHSTSSFRKCANCHNLNRGNICSVHRISVSDDDVCPRFYRISVVLGGGVNPR